MKTYLIVWFNSNGAKPSEVTDRLLGMGFKPTHGNYDYVYDWHRTANMEEVLRIGDRVHETLEGLDVMFKIETI